MIIYIYIRYLVYLYTIYIYIYIYQDIYQQPKTYPHPRIPAARLFSVFLCFPTFSSTWGNPEVGGGDNFWGS